MRRAGLGDLGYVEGTNAIIEITSLSDDELKWYSPAGSIGTTAEFVWNRAK